MTNTRFHLGLAAAIALTTGTLAAPPTIHELAPDGTIFVAGVGNAKKTLARLETTSLWELWRSPDLAQMRTEIRDEFQRELKEMMHELELDEDALKMPTGALGLAVFTVMNHELGMAEPGILLAADYGEHAAKTAELVAAAREQADEDDEVIYEERDVRGRTVHCFDLSQVEVDVVEPDFADDDFHDIDGFDGMGGGPDPAEEAFNEMFIVQDESLFLLSNDMATIAHALEVCDDAAQPILPNRDDFTGLMEQLGEGDMTAALLTRDLGRLVSAMDPTGMTMMLTPMLRQMVGEVQGFGMGARLDGADAMVEMTQVMYMPRGKAGLTALLQEPGPCGDVPSFAGADTISFSTINFDFAGVPDAVRPLIQMMQMMMPPQPGADAPAIDQTLEQITRCLGRRLHLVQTLDQPVEIDSLKQVVAVECRKPQELEHFLGLMAQDMGMEARDFLGHRLYTVDLDMFGMVPMDMAAMPTDPPAIGLGGGFVFSGPAPAVEQALRSTSNAGNASLADEPAFRRAVATLGSDSVVGWGYTNIVDAFDAGMTISRKQNAELAKELEREDFGMPGDDRGGAFQNVLGDDWPEGLDAALLREHIGPMAWKMMATDAGFVVKSYLLEAEAGR